MAPPKKGIDWGFISGPGIEGESKHLTGYVPDAGKSGFTVGSFDVGQHSYEDVRTILQRYANKEAGGGMNVGNIRQDLLDKVGPFAGKIGITDEEAKKVSFDKTDIDYLTGAKRHSFERNISKKEGWGDLGEGMQTVLGSVGWQYGMGSPQFNKLYGMRGDTSAVSGELLSMGGSEYGYRRGKESQYLLNSEQKKSIDPSGIAMEAMSKIDKPLGF